MLVVLALIAMLTAGLAQPQARVHGDITATIFWVGEGATANSPSNAASAWDDDWLAHFGGVDDPSHRNGWQPAAFAPSENSFYCALPYNDCPGGVRRAETLQIIPWANTRAWDRRESLCKNQWVAIRHGNKMCFAQWEDVGPFYTDDDAYVFGTAAPKNTANHNAGIDVSPAVRDFLDLQSGDKVSWWFVEEKAVPAGPWRERVTKTQIYWR
jgi:hypothetical protein